MEAVETQETTRLQEERNDALTRLFDLRENTNELPSSSMRWDIPETADLVQRLRSYLQTEMSLREAQVKAARPGFDTKADSEHLTFGNALNFLETGGEHGRAGMEKVLRRLYRVQVLREYKYYQDGKSENWGNKENQREWMHILSSQVAVARLIGDQIGKKEKDSLGYNHRTWEGYREDKGELESLAALVDRAYSASGLQV